MPNGKFAMSSRGNKTCYLLIFFIVSVFWGINFRLCQSLSALHFYFLLFKSIEICHSQRQPVFLKSGWCMLKGNGVISVPLFRETETHHRPVMKKWLIIPVSSSPHRRVCKCAYLFFLKHLRSSSYAFPMWCIGADLNNISWGVNYKFLNTIQFLNNVCSAPTRIPKIKISL